MPFQKRIVFFGLFATYLAYGKVFSPLHKQRGSHSNVWQHAANAQFIDHQTAFDTAYAVFLPLVSIFVR